MEFLPNDSKNKLPAFALNPDIHMYSWDKYRCWLKGHVWMLNHHYWRLRGKGAFQKWDKYSCFLHSVIQCDNQWHPLFLKCIIFHTKVVSLQSFVTHHKKTWKFLKMLLKIIVKISDNNTCTLLKTHLSKHPNNITLPSRFRKNISVYLVDLFAAVLPPSPLLLLLMEEYTPQTVLTALCLT